MSKQAKYKELIAKRKEFKFADEELTNPAKTDYDGNYVEPWSQWQGNLDANIVVVGQEFCDTDTFHCVRGTVERYEKKYEFATNRNLPGLFKHFGIDLYHPKNPQNKSKMFFTNRGHGIEASAHVVPDQVAVGR